MMKYVLLLCCLVLTACTSLPTVKQLPPQQQNVRVFKVEQLNAQHQLQQAKLLFSALSTALNPNHALFTFSAINPVANGADYFIQNKKVWQIRQLSNTIEIDLADQSHWRIEELN